MRVSFGTTKPFIGHLGGVCHRAPHHPSQAYLNTQYSRANQRLRTTHHSSYGLCHSIESGRPFVSCPDSDSDSGSWSLRRPCLFHPTEQRQRIRTIRPPRRNQEPIKIQGGQPPPQKNMNRDQYWEFEVSRGGIVTNPRVLYYAFIHLSILIPILTGPRGESNTCRHTYRGHDLRPVHHLVRLPAEVQCSTLDRFSYLRHHRAPH